MAGVGGGAVVLLGIYGYYHFSGAKTAVNTVRQMSQTAESLKNKAVEATPSVKSMMHFLRQAAYSYTAAFPGAKHAVDLTFDQIDQIAEKNGPEVEKILKQVYTDLSKAASEGGDKVSDNVVNVIQEGVSKIQQLSSSLSAGAIAPLLANHPALKSALGDSYNQLNDLGNKYGPEARKITEDAVKQIKDLTDKGVNGETIAKAVSIAKQKLEEVRKLGQQVGSEAYSKAAEGARPYLDKAPDVKKYLEESVDSLKEYVGDDGVKLINETYSELEAAGKKGDTAKLMQIAKSKIGQLQKLAQDKGGDLAKKASGKASQIPGVDQLFESVPSLKSLHELRELAQDKGGDFEKILNETYEELKTVLEKKGKEAKDLTGDATQEAKKKAQK